LLTGSFARLLPLLVLSQALGATLEAASAIVLRRREGVGSAWRSILFVLANAGVAILVATHEPLQLAYSAALVVLLGVGYAVRSSLRSLNTPR
jgi:hypothetical protein